MKQPTDIVESRIQTHKTPHQMDDAPKGKRSPVTNSHLLSSKILFPGVEVELLHTHALWEEELSTTYLRISEKVVKEHVIKF